MDTDTITVIQLRDTPIPRAELESNITINNGKAYFMIKHDWYNIHSIHLHDKIEDLIEDGYLLLDVKFKPMAVDGDDVIFLVTVNDTTEYLLNNLPDDDDDL